LSGQGEPEASARAAALRIRLYEGLQAAIDNQYLEIVDQRHLDDLGEIDSITLQPYSASLVVVEADEVAKVTGLTWPVGDGTRFNWEAAAGATAYDIVRGDLRLLRIDAGLASVEPFSCGQTESTGIETETPPAGRGFYYLVRGRAGADSGTWGSAQRNSEIGACP